MSKNKGMSEKHFNLLKGYISTLNNMIQQLKEEDIYIHANDDFDFAIDHVYYSQAQDKVIVKFEDIIVKNIIENEEE